MTTCATCGTTAQADGATFCFSCGSALAAPPPACGSCGNELHPGARFCPFCGATQDTEAQVPPAVAQPAPHGTARKITSVLFGDLVGFTTISESRDAEEVRELLSAYFEECRAIVSRYGGELEKFIGDAVMAVWGLPVTREDDAERAVRAGMELVERVQALGDRINVPGLNMRVGITTAEVAVTLGATGQGMVAGDPVNTAARIQSTASPGEVWVDETTRSFSSSAIAFEDAGSHAMKGKAEPVPLWRVRAVIAGVGGDRRDDGLEADLTGRDRELRLVKEFFHGVQETLRPGMLVVDGEPGVGKSRLGWEFEKYVDGFEANVLWHRGRCLSYGEGVAYYALAEAVRGRLAILAGAGEEAEAGPDNRQLLHRGLAACVPDASERTWLEPRLAALLGLDAGAPFPREELYAAWTAFFKYVGLWQADEGTPQPVVLVIDDAQYADGGLLAFLEHLLAAADYPVFVLALARPELLADHPALIGNRRVTVVHLEPLTSAEMAGLLDQMISGLPESIRDELVARSEGIPLYAIETVRALADQDLVVIRDGQFELTDPQAVDLGALTAPASLQALIAARLDTLPPDERKVVDRASVLGLVFTADGLATLCADVADLDQAIAGLVRREVLRRDNDRLSADYGDYRFVQGAVRQVAYGMLSRRDRKAIHLTVARALQAEFEGRSDAYELAPIIAQHYLDAIDAVLADPDVPELTTIASDHLERAADRAAGLGAPREAAAHLAMALSRCEPERRLRIQSKLAHELLVSGDHAGAIEHAAEAIKGFEAAGDSIAAAAPAEDLARALVYSDGDLGRAETLVRDQLQRLPDTVDAFGARLSLLNALATVLLRSGSAEANRPVAQEAMELAELIGDPRKILESWNFYAITSIGTLPHLSVALLERVAELAEEHRAMRALALARINLAGFLVWDDTEASVGWGRDALESARSLGDRYMLAFAQSNLSATLVSAGEWEEALALGTLEDVRHFMAVTVDITLRLMAHARDEEWPSVAEAVNQDPEEMADDPGWQVEYQLDRALEAHANGLAEAVELAVDVIRRCDLVGGSAGDAWLLWLLASDVIHQCGDRDALVEALAYVDVRKGPRPVGLRAQRSRLQAVLGQDGSLTHEEIEAAFRDALTLVRQWDSPVFDAHICADYGDWLVRQGRLDEGAELLGRAREVYERLGARRWLSELDGRSAPVG